MMKLAIKGGKPARSKPLPPNYPGATVMGAEEANRITETIKSRSPFRYYGPDLQHTVQRLEESMSFKLDIPYVLGVSSCTAALIVALKALGIGYGDKVIVPANTFLATPGAVICSHAVPVFVDVDESLHIDPHDLERVMDDEVKAIIAVSILGNPVDLDPILEFAQKHKIAVIEDVAQSCGAKYKGKYVGTRADIGVFSFQVNKILTAGEGGALVTRNHDLFERAVRYHDQGLFRDKARYGVTPDEETNAFIGQNYRMSELAGSVLIEQWNRLDGIIATMKKHCRNIRDPLLKELPDIRFRTEADGDGSIGSALGMIFPTSEFSRTFIEFLGKENIGTYLLYGGRPVYLLPQLFHQRTADRNNFPFDYPFKKPVIYGEAMCPQAVDLMARTVYLPISPLLTETDIPEIVEGIVKIYGHICNQNHK
jgi:8-amino-3,8-dideoxy-alpha-D-manno-octulosonate transaminase